MFININADGTFNNSIKLFKHLDKLSEWEKTGDTYPIMASIDLTNACNNFCPLCMGVRPDNNSIPYEKVKDIIMQLKDVGIKSIGLGGGGDPSVHPKINDIIRFIKSEGLEVGMYSNCYMLSNKLMETMMDSLTYLRVSLDADSPETYKITHGMNEKAFYAVLDNIRKLIALRRTMNKPIVIGAGYLVGPETILGIYGATKLYKELGMDYIRIRPFFDMKPFTEEQINQITEELKKSMELQDDSFTVTSPTHRLDWMMKGNAERPYGKCYIHHFETVITANQKLYPCCHLSGMEEYCYGDLRQNTFKEVWNSERRKQAYENITFKDCPNPCSLDGHNRMLWGLKEPVLHPNFL